MNDQPPRTAVTPLKSLARVSWRPLTGALVAYAVAAQSLLIALGGFAIPAHANADPAAFELCLHDAQGKRGLPAAELPITQAAVQFAPSVSPDRIMVACGPIRDRCVMGPKLRPIPSISEAEHRRPSRRWSGIRHGEIHDKHRLESPLRLNGGNSRSLWRSSLQRLLKRPTTISARSTSPSPGPARRQRAQRRALLT